MTSNPVTIIASGRVIDPANRRDGVADIAVGSGKIVAVEPGLAGGIAEATIVDATRWSSACRAAATAAPNTRRSLRVNTC